MRKILLSCCALLLAALCVASDALPSQAQSAGVAVVSPNNPYVVEYPLRFAPLNIAVEAPGRIWFTLPEAHALGRLVVEAGEPLSYTVTEYATPTANSEPYDLAVADGFVWFTERAGNRLGRLEIATGEIVEYRLPQANAEPTGIALDADGQVWVALRGANSIGRFDPASEEFITDATYAFPRPNGLLEDITVRGENIYVTAPGGNFTGWYRPALSPGRRWRVDSTTAGPAIQIESDPRGASWITLPQDDLLGRYAPGTLALWRFTGVPEAAEETSEPTGLALAVLDEVWQLFFTQRGSGQVGLFTVDPASTNVVWVRETALNMPGSAPWGVAVDGDGHAWIADSGGRSVAEWLPPYTSDQGFPIIELAAEDAPPE